MNEKNDLPYQQWYNQPLPVMKEIEMAQFFRPEYETQLVHFKINTKEWKHRIACRFGSPRQSNVGDWSGESYRYDIFEHEECFNVNAIRPRVAIRWQNGSGQGWIIDNSNSRRNESNLFYLIVDQKYEGTRWDYCHAIYESICKTEMAARLNERQNIFTAFVENRLKKIKKQGRYIMRILTPVEKIMIGNEKFQKKLRRTAVGLGAGPNSVGVDFVKEDHN